MKKFICCISILLSLGCDVSAAKNDTNLIWFDQYLPRITETVTGEITFELIPILNTLTEIWLKRDGGTTAEVSLPIMSALIKHPKLMLPMLTEDSKSFERWLKQFNGIVFTDFSGDRKDQLERMHSELEKSMIECLTRCDKELIPFAEQIVEQLKNTMITVVD